jgi:hypothetical protein
MWSTPKFPINPRKQFGFFLTAFCLISQLCHANAFSASNFKEGYFELFTLQSDIGQYLVHTPKNPQMGYYQDSATLRPIKDPQDNHEAKWLFYFIGNGKVTIQAHTTNYLSRCANCVPNSQYQDSPSVHLEEADSSCIWSLIHIHNETYALRADNGLYLARCYDCIAKNSYSKNTAMVHATSYLNATEAHWTLKWYLFWSSLDDFTEPYKSP